MKANYVLHGARRVVALGMVTCVFTVVFAVHQVGAVIIYGTGDPTANTSAPDGVLVNSGWQFEGTWGSFLGTPIAPQYFLAAQHVGGSVGQTFTYNGVSYVTTGYFDDTNSDLRIWQVDGVFPTYAPLYSLNDELGKSMVVIGRGTQKGADVVVSVVQTNYFTNSFDLKTLGLSRKQAQNLYPDATFKGTTMTVVTSDIVTNDVLKGWQMGASDGVTRWGQNQVTCVGSFLVAAFDQNLGSNACFLSGGDSSGGVFIPDTNGVWRLAGINYGIDGPFGLTTTDSFYAAIFDESGLYVGGSYVPNDGQIRPASFYATRISNRLGWIQSIIGP